MHAIRKQVHMKRTSVETQARCNAGRHEHGRQATCILRPRCREVTSGDLEIGMCLAQEPTSVASGRAHRWHGTSRHQQHHRPAEGDPATQRDITIAIIEHDMHVVFSLAQSDHRAGSGHTAGRGHAGKHQRATPKYAKRTLGESALSKG